MTIGKYRAIDHFRRNSLLDRKHLELGHEFEIKEMTPPDFDSALDDNVGDDLLKLIFISCHPVLSIEAQLALTLRPLGGLTTDEIARAFLVSESTIAQRIVRAKRTSQKSKFLLKFLAVSNSPRASHPSSKSFISISTRPTLRLQVMTG
jgi:predicted RNA polymerase sigma factor